MKKSKWWKKFGKQIIKGALNNALKKGGKRK